MRPPADRHECYESVACKHRHPTTTIWTSVHRPYPTARGLTHGRGHLFNAPTTSRPVKSHVNNTKPPRPSEKMTAGALANMARRGAPRHVLWNHAPTTDNPAQRSPQPQHRRSTNCSHAHQLPPQQPHSIDHRHLQLANPTSKQPPVRQPSTTANDGGRTRQHGKARRPATCALEPRTTDNPPPEVATPPTSQPYQMQPRTSISQPHQQTTTSPPASQPTHAATLTHNRQGHHHHGGSDNRQRRQQPRRQRQPSAPPLSQPHSNDHSHLQLANPTSKQPPASQPTHAATLTHNRQGHHHHGGSDNRQRRQQPRRQRQPSAPPLSQPHSIDHSHLQLANPPANISNTNAQTRGRNNPTIAAPPIVSTHHRSLSPASTQPRISHHHRVTL